MNITIAGIGKIKRFYYFNNHVRFFAGLFMKCGYNVVMKDNGIGDDTLFSYSFNDKDFIAVNFSDFLNGSVGTVSFHHNGTTGYPFIPIVEKFNGTSGTRNNRIVYRCREYGDGRVRRQNVGNVLRGIADCGFVDKEIFIAESFNSLAGVFVPGACPNMLDRGQLSFMLAGCCTISPYIPELLPVIGQLVGNEDYVLCSTDLSDVRERVEWCVGNRDRCLEIGNNSKRKLVGITTPEFLTSYLVDIWHSSSILF